MKNTTEEKREAIPNSVSRMLLAGIGVLLQVLWIFWLALKLNDYSTAIQVCTSVLTFLITLRIYGLHINSAYKISWIILILLFPIFGLTIYLLFGRSGAVSVMRRRFGDNMTMLRRYHAPILQQRRALPYPDRITRNHARYLHVRVGAVEVLLRQIVAAGKADAPVHNGDFAVVAIVHKDVQNICRTARATPPMTTPM